MIFNLLNRNYICTNVITYSHLGQYWYAGENDRLSEYHVNQKPPTIVLHIYFIYIIYSL